MSVEEDNSVSVHHYCFLWTIRCQFIIIASFGGQFGVSSSLRTIRCQFIIIASFASGR